jgi:hypothetical protein
MTLIIQKPTGAKLNLAQTYVGIDDPDAASYITAVETADGESLETAVKVAIHSFVKGCKSDGIWSAIKASCILAGARTLAGALVPLVGTAPTNNNFVSGDYNRKTGLVGNGSTKYLNSNRNNNADPQNSHHLSAFASSSYSGITVPIGFYGPGNTERNVLYYDGGFLYASRGVTAPISSASASTGFAGVSRGNAVTVASRYGGNAFSKADTSLSPGSGNTYIFSLNQNGTSNFFVSARLAFYSIGESLNLALLDARVTTLINAFAAAIP